MRYLIFAAFYVLIGIGITAVSSPTRAVPNLSENETAALVLMWPATVAGRLWADYTRTSEEPTRHAN